MLLQQNAPLLLMFEAHLPLLGHCQALAAE
jgi:hypothetical protein